MTIYRSAYDTLACRDFVVSKIEKQLLEVLHTGQLNERGGQNIRQLQGGMASSDHVPSFAHPFVLKDKSSHMQADPGDSLEYVVVDVRPFGKFDKNQGHFVVRNKTEYAFANVRGNLNKLWLENPAALQNVTGLPMKMYASWISENCGRRFALDPGEQGKLQVLAAFFYASLFLEQHKLSDADLHRIATVIKNNTGMSAEMILGVLEQFKEPIAGLGQFCTAAHQVTESVRLKELSPGFMVDLLGGTWFNSNKKETIAVALEHPPTWLAILMVCADDRSYKRTYITTLLERTDRRDKGMQVRRALATLISQDAEDVVTSNRGL